MCDLTTEDIVKAFEDYNKYGRKTMPLEEFLRPYPAELKELVSPTNDDALPDEEE